MTIAFVHTGKALLPEIGSYRQFFELRGISTIEVLPEKVSENRADIEWHFMGQHSRRVFPDNIIIHEYASLSTPPFAGPKNLLKKILSCKPDYRIYLNEFVRDGMKFSDNVPYGYRDMFIMGDLSGISEIINRKYDFIYLGSVEPARKPEQLLNCFSEGPMKQYSLLVLSDNYKGLEEKYKGYTNIYFEGPVTAADVPKYIFQSRFGINYQPDIYPYNQQTSSKLIEYLSCKLPVVSSNNSWIRNFKEQYGGNYFLLREDFSNFSGQMVEQFPYSFPDLSDWQFSYRLQQSGICQFLEKRTGVALL